MKLIDFQNWLDTFLNFEKTQTKGIFWLENMKFICNLLGNPQDSIPCIHVAGSKGKGSVSCMIANIINKNGFKCGIYSSPHITDFRERISSTEGFFSDEIYEKSADELVNCISSINPLELPGNKSITWFELVTVFAFLCFKNAKVDYVVYEVGLGGRLDSTNIIKPLLSVLMPIELEHTEFLGNTITEIAAEKAGIIKNNIPCIVSKQKYKDAENVFLKKAEEMSSEIFFTKKIIKNISYFYSEKKLMHVDFSIPQKKLFISSDLKLVGDVQADNAATAALAASLIFPDIKQETISDGLSKAFIPGRFEIQDNLIFDGAHTVNSIANTINVLKSLYPFSKYRLLFACAGDKDIKDIIPLFKNIFQTIIFTKPETVRNCNPDLMLSAAETNGIKAKIIENPTQAFNKLKSELKTDDILLITGSFYLVSEIKKILTTSE